MKLISLRVCNIELTSLMPNLEEGKRVTPLTKHLQHPHILVLLEERLNGPRIAVRDKNGNI